MFITWYCHFSYRQCLALNFLHNIVMKRYSTVCYCKYIICAAVDFQQVGRAPLSRKIIMDETKMLFIGNVWRVLKDYILHS